jgi:hypothetical protein
MGFTEMKYIFLTCFHREQMFLVKPKADTFVF